MSNSVKRMKNRVRPAKTFSRHHISGRICSISHKLGDASLELRIGLKVGDDDSMPCELEKAVVYDVGLFGSSAKDFLMTRHALGDLISVYLEQIEPVNCREEDGLITIRIKGEALGFSDPKDKNQGLVSSGCPPLPAALDYCPLGESQV